VFRRGVEVSRKQTPQGLQEQGRLARNCGTQRLDHVLFAAGALDCVVLPGGAFASLVEDDVASNGDLPPVLVDVRRLVARVCGRESLIIPDIIGCHVEGLILSRNQQKVSGEQVVVAINVMVRVVVCPFFSCNCILLLLLIECSRRIECFVGRI